MKKNHTIIISIVLILSVIFFIFGFIERNKENIEISYTPPDTPLLVQENVTKIDTNTKNDKVPPGRQEKLATLEVNNKSYQTEIERDTSVYDFMDMLRQEGKINFKDKTYLGLGKFIEEINGTKGNGDEFWIYYVNNKKAYIGVSNYKINPGDIVSWKYEKDIY